MFDGDGFGLGLTVVALGEPELPPGPVERRTRWSEVLPPEVRSRAGQAMELSRLQAEKARMFAYEAALVCGFAGNCPAAEVQVLSEARLGPRWPPEQRGPAVSEFFVDELAAALDASVTSASYVWLHARTLCERLPGTWAALADGELDVPRARAVIGEVARSPEAAPGVLLAVEAAVLPRAGELTPTALRAAVRAELVAHDAAFAERRRRRAERTADAAVRADPDAPGRADLVAGMSVEDAHACGAVADGLARAARAAGDDRPIGVLRAQAVRDRILGPDTGADRPPVTATVTVIAPLDALEHVTGPRRRPDQAASRRRAGRPARRDARRCGADRRGRHRGRRAAAGCPTGRLRRLPPRRGADRGWGSGRSAGADRAGQRAADHRRSPARTAPAAGRTGPGGLRPPTGGDLRIALTDPDGALRAVLTRPDLEQLARRGCPQHPPGADCGCGLLDRPPGVDRYRPSTAQHRFIWTRDRRCRMPGCTARASWADLDHVIPHARGGATSCDNLCCLCRRHHRLKTLACGWTTRIDPDGTYTVTTPSGITRTSRPPGLEPAVGAAGRRGPPDPPDERPPF